MKKLVAIAIGIALAGTATVAIAGRNSSGTYSLPSGNPVVSGTSISSTWANNTLGDLSSEITNSLDRQGRGGMLAPFRVPNGSSSAPTLSFTNETGSGWYRAALGDVRLTIGGTDKFTVTSTGATFANGVTAPSATISGALSASTATVSGATLTVSTGDVTLPKSGDQTINKSGGGLWLGTSDFNSLTFKTNGAAAAFIDPAGSMSMQSHVIYDLGTPTTSTMAATKGYVDGRTLYGIVNYTGSVGRVSDGGISIARTGEGVYTITHPSLTSTSVVAVTPRTTSDYFGQQSVYVQFQGDPNHTYYVYTYENGVGASDASFSFIIYP